MAIKVGRTSFPSEEEGKEERKGPLAAKDGERGRKIPRSERSQIVFWDFSVRSIAAFRRRESRGEAVHQAHSRLHLPIHRLGVEELREEIAFRFGLEPCKSSRMMGADHSDIAEECWRARFWPSASLPKNLREPRLIARTHPFFSEALSGGLSFEGSKSPLHAREGGRFPGESDAERSGFGRGKGGWRGSEEPVERGGEFTETVRPLHPPSTRLRFADRSLER